MSRRVKVTTYYKTTRLYDTNWSEIMFENTRRLENNKVHMLLIRTCLRKTWIRSYRLPT